MPTTPSDNRTWLQRQFFALDADDLPETVVLRERKYRRERTFKYDFFAGTGLYRLDEPFSNLAIDLPEQVVVKIYRYRRFFGLPMRWIGKISVRHEARLYRMLHDISGVPRFAGFVGPTGFAHDFIPGEPLRRENPVPDAFFDQLRDLLTTIHQRNVSYVDLHKLANILIGEDGRPYLIDFQISYAPRLRWPIVRWISRRVLKHFQREDWYHYFKHKRRLRKDLLTPRDYEESYNPTLANRIHRVISQPYFWIRRRAMALLQLKSTE